MTASKSSNVSSNAGFGSHNPTDPPAVDVEREPMPDKAPDTGSNRNDPPPARTGRGSQAPENVTEGDPDDNPTHHTGHIPPPATANRE